MHYISLNEITEEHLLGAWKVEDRILVQDKRNIFEHSNKFELNKGLYCATNGSEIKGHWSISREKEVIYNPLIKFFVGSQFIEQAIVTRLLYAVENKIDINRLTIYFATGMELSLLKIGY